MATRQQQAASADRKTSRAAALATLEGEPLPLPTEPHTTPPEPDQATADEIMALGACGLTDTQIANHLGISHDDLRGWGNAHSAISTALSRARTAAKAWWEEQARRAIITENNRFPAGAWSQVMKARFKDYDDKPQVVIDLSALVRVQIPVTPEPLQERVSDASNALIQHEPVGLVQSQTGTSSNSGNGADGPSIALPGPDDIDDADPRGGGG